MMEQGNESSVEEILRSIKRVIAENDDVRGLTQPRIRPAAPHHEAQDGPAQHGPAQHDPARHDIARASHFADSADVLNLSERDMAPAEPAPAHSGQEPDGGGLLADEAAQSVRHSLAALAAMTEPGARPQIVRSGETSLEGMVRDMLRPMLKEWLDAHLPDMVERAIASEIARLRQ